MLICQSSRSGRGRRPRGSAPCRGGEEDRRDAEEADVERPDPEVEQVASDRVPPRTRYINPKVEHRRQREVRGHWGPSLAVAGGARLVATARGARRAVRSFPRVGPRAS
jgi:hypothetical protein